MMATRLDRKNVFAEIEATQDDHYRAQRDELLPLVRFLQQAEAHEDYMRLQLELRERFAARQEAMALRRQALEADKAERNRLAPLKPQPREAVKELGRRIAIRERLHLRDSVIQHVIRCIADGMVWRAARFDRALFAVLGDRERVGRFPAEEGAAPERKRAQELWDQGVLPFFNDLTNCLREGDLTILYGDWPDASVAVEEVKRDGRPRPSSAQSRRLDRRLHLLNTGWDPVGANGDPLALWRLPVRYEHSLTSLAGVLAEARRDGFADVQPHPALIVSATDLTWAVDHQDEVGNWMSRAAEQRGWTLSDDGIFAGSALVTRVQERRRSSSCYAPLAIFPLCADDIIDLLMGFFDYSVVLRVDDLVPDFVARGIDVEFATGREANQVFLRAHRASHTVTVPSHLREQLLRELMSIETLVSIVEALLDGVQLGAPVDVKRLVVCDERSAWSGAPVYVG